VNNVEGGSTETGTITANGFYTAPSSSSANEFQVNFEEADARSIPAFVTLFDPMRGPAGSVSGTENPLVASYSVFAPAGALVHVQFGPDTSYALSTSAQPAPWGGGPVGILVAGMRASSTYHMQAVIDLTNGSRVTDTDHVFTTGTIPPARIPVITAQQVQNSTPSPGIELFSFVPPTNTNLLTAFATDLAGNVIWYYDLEPGLFPFPIKPLQNGHMLVITSLGATVSAGPNEIREVDLAGTIVNRITIDSLNKALSGIANFQAASFHHDILPLPNGHMILLVDYNRTINNQPGVPDGTVVTGDALVDWDPKLGPVWTWSTFDHLDVSHAPYGLPDWTHSNAVIYSPDDGNLILSMRNQNWIIKINYGDGSGDGSILWRFGPGGDFTLPPGQDPIEWNYGQHYPTIVGSNSAGIFSMMFFNNGNNRLLDTNATVCGTLGTPNCYSSVPIFQLNEFTKTATVLWEDNLSPAYSICCGDALILPNQDVEFDIAFAVPGTSTIEEVTQTTPPQLVWQMSIQGETLAYRGIRIPSLYPGLDWSLSATLPESR
jgi:arylsulfate sulfotransferase